MLKTCKRSSDISINHTRKRIKLNDSTVNIIHKHLNSEKGEAIQALHMVFESGSFSFETLQRNDLSSKFVTFLNLEGYSFIGYGNSKILSRSCACRTALLSLFDDFKNGTSKRNNDPPRNVPVAFNSSNTADELPDVISSLVLGKYDELRRSSKENLPWFKVVSALVMVRDNNYRNGTVIVLSTGSKCIEPKNIRTDGSVVLDSHAEVLLRRAFQLFLYSQVERCRNDIDSILHHNGKKYELIDGVSFYLFISSAPCGDCRVFATSNRDTFIDKHPNRVCRGVLRIKLDGSNSTVPAAKYENDTRLMIMSCSDKLLKLNILGWQGSLLHNFIEPIYMTGLIIGDLFQPSHIKRALHERLGENDFPTPFRLNEMKIYAITNKVKFITKSPKISINWIHENSVEIMNSTSGKKTDGNMSRLCKRNLLKQFLKLWKMADIGNESKLTYDYFKNIAVDYQQTKRIFYELLEKLKLGQWINRNRIYNQFSIQCE